MKSEKPYKGPFLKEEAKRFQKYFIEISKKPYLEIEIGNPETGYKHQKVENTCKGAFLRRRAKTSLYDVFMKIQD